MVQIDDSTGTGYSAKVNKNNRLATFAVTETEAIAALAIGNGYNINTGDITVSGNQNNAVLYMKNNEDEPFFVEAIAVGIGSGTVGTGTAGMCEVKIVRNPTAGTIVSDASPVADNANRNFGASKTFQGLAYKAVAPGETFTDGTDIAQFYQGHSGRLYATVNFELQKGDSIGITLNTYGATGVPVTCYAAVIGFVHDANEA